MSQMSNLETVKGDQNLHLFKNRLSTYGAVATFFYLLLTLLKDKNHSLNRSYWVCGIKNLSFIPIQKNVQMTFVKWQRFFGCALHAAQKPISRDFLPTALWLKLFWCT
jgi:hypothetical protein